MMLRLLRIAAVLAAGLFVVSGPARADKEAPAEKKSDGWDDVDPLDELLDIAKGFRKKQKADGSLDPCRARGFHSMLKRAGKSKAPLPVVVALLDELWGRKKVAKTETMVDKYPSLTAQTRDLVKEALIYLARLDRDADRALPAVLRVLERRKTAQLVKTVVVPGRYVSTYNAYLRRYES